MNIVIDLNADLGESEQAIVNGRDFELMRYVTSANVACGGHAGDRSTMEQVIRVARESGVSVGAHPSYPDRVHFGRLPMVISAPNLEQSLCAQITALCEVADQSGMKVSHVKPHGALYHATNRDPEIARTFARAVINVDRKLFVVGQAKGRSLQLWKDMGLRCASEAFADRSYEPDGTLRERSLGGAVIEDARVAAEQAIQIAIHHRVRTAAGSYLELRADTLCIHSDTPGAVDIAREASRGLIAAGVQLQPLSSSPDSLG